MAQTLTPEVAQRFSEIALGHLRREYPHKLDHVMNGPEDVRSPSALHPIFYGSFDWHSCVHGYWMLLRVRRLWGTVWLWPDPWPEPPPGLAVTVAPPPRPLQL